MGRVFPALEAEETDHPREVVEAALAHMVRNKVEAAYMRSDLVRAPSSTHGGMGDLSGVPKSGHRDLI